jgi:hypothetical protein
VSTYVGAMWPPTGEDDIVLAPRVPVAAPHQVRAMSGGAGVGAAAGCAVRWRVLINAKRRRPIFGASLTLRSRADDAERP